MARRERRTRQLSKHVALQQSQAQKPAMITAVIGGQLFKDIVHPVLVGGLPLFTVGRDGDRPWISFGVRDRHGNLIATVDNNEIVLRSANYELIQHRYRKVVKEKVSGRVCVDLLVNAPRARAEIELSCVLYVAYTHPAHKMRLWLPIYFHPDRIKTGDCPLEKAARICRLLTESLDRGGPGFVTQGIPLVFMGCRFINFDAAIGLPTLSIE